MTLQCGIPSCTVAPHKQIMEETGNKGVKYVVLDQAGFKLL